MSQRKFVNRREPAHPTIVSAEAAGGTRPITRWLALAAIVGGSSFVWLVVLPMIARRPAMRAHLQWLDRRGIDPAAMYYTDLPVMEEILSGK